MTAGHRGSDWGQTKGRFHGSVWLAGLQADGTSRRELEPPFMGGQGHWASSKWRYPTRSSCWSHGFVPWGNTCGCCRVFWPGAKYFKTERVQQESPAWLSICVWHWVERRHHQDVCQQGQAPGFPPPPLTSFSVLKDACCFSVLIKSDLNCNQHGSNIFVHISKFKIWKQGASCLSSKRPSWGGNPRQYSWSFPWAAAALGSSISAGVSHVHLLPINDNQSSCDLFNLAWHFLPPMPFSAKNMYLVLIL